MENIEIDCKRSDRLHIPKRVIHDANKDKKSQKKHGAVYMENSSPGLPLYSESTLKERQLFMRFFRNSCQPFTMRNRKVCSGTM